MFILINSKRNAKESNSHHNNNMYHTNYTRTNTTNAKYNTLILTLIFHTSVPIYMYT